jgi:signal transduction histidine kinase
LHDKQSLNLKPLIEELIVQFDEIFQDKQLTVTCSLMDREIYISSYLADILLNNLLSNAIRHNYTGGSIVIELTQSNLAFKNTGETNPLHADKIFTRFQKAPNSEGSGLGLTISRQICENFEARLDYNFCEQYHVFTVTF